MFSRIKAAWQILTGTSYEVEEEQTRFDAVMVDLAHIQEHLDEFRREDMAMGEAMLVAALMNTDMDTKAEAFMALMAVLFVKNQFHQALDNNLITDLRGRFEKLAEDIPVVKEIYDAFDAEFLERHKSLDNAFLEAEHRILTLVKEACRQRAIAE
jgi:hypothetical protein